MLIDNEYVKTKTEFAVVKYKTELILGLDDTRILKFVGELNVKSKVTDKEKFLKENKDVFTSLGKFPDKAVIKVMNGAIPNTCLARRVPLNIKEKLKVVLNDLTDLGVIKEVKEPSEWVSNIVIVEKPNGNLRICLDPAQLNKYLVREVCEIPSIDEIKCELANKSYYTVIDIKDGFYHNELEEESSKLCTFATPFGAYRFLRMPSGCSVAPELFQKYMNRYFGDIPNVTLYFDDILISANTKEEDGDTLCRVVERARKLNIKFNADKVQFCTKQVKYVGFLFNKNEIKPDNSRITAISELKNRKIKNNYKEY